MLSMSALLEKILQGAIEDLKEQYPELQDVEAKVLLVKKIGQD